MTDPKSFIGKCTQSLPTPAFVVDISTLEQNCNKMLETARENGIKLRGQVKTHKTVEGGVIQTGGTKRGLVTSTFKETEMYQKAGFDDILYGYPLLESHMTRNFKLCAKLEQYHLFVTNMDAVDILLRYQPPRGKKWSVFLKIDCGNGRAGIWWEDQVCVEIARKIQNNPATLSLEGLYVHCSDSYKDPRKVEEVRDRTVMLLVELKKRMEKEGIAIKNIGIGSTPTCSHSGTSMKALTEIHPGNYVFYDVQQMRLGSCQEKDIAGKVLTRILGHYPKRNQMLIDCGFLGLTQQGFSQLNGTFALVKNNPHLKVTAMTQEIGYIEASEGESIDFSKYPIGSTLLLLPFHSCATAACYQEYYIHDESETIQEVWTPCKGW